MDKRNDLILKLESLEEENRLLKKMLGQSLIPDYPDVHNAAAISGAFAGTIPKAPYCNGIINNAVIPPANFQAEERLSNEKYISALSRNLNSLADEKSVLKTLLQDLSIKSSASHIYYIQLDESSCIISSIVSSGNNDKEDIFSFQEFSSSRTDLNIRLDDLYDIGSLTLKRKPGEMFFTSNSWISRI